MDVREEKPKKKFDSIIRKDRNMRLSAIFTIVTNVILIAVLIVALFSYISYNKTDTYNQNIENLTSIATAKSELVEQVLTSSSSELKNTYNYCNNKTVTEALGYLSDVIDPQSEYQLLKFNPVLSKSSTYVTYSGYSTKKKIDGDMNVTYENTALTQYIDLYKNTKGQVIYSQNFTNKTDGIRYYAAFCGISLIENGVMSDWFLLKLHNGEHIINQLRTYTQYNVLTTAICDQNGKYLTIDSGFKEYNIYDYIAAYNDLSLDERNALRTAVQSDKDGVGTLEYDDFRGRDSVFIYSKCSNSEDWYVFITLPKTEFVSDQLITFFPLIIIIFLVILLLFNAWRLLELVKMLSKSVASERLANASKSSFLSRMSHEIRTPLNAVIGYMTIAKNNKNNTTKIEDCIDKTEISAKHLLLVINDILDISAIESGKIQLAKDSFNFKSLIDSITVMFYTQATNKNVKFDVIFENVVDESLIGDQMRVNQILINLLNNAVKFTSADGSVSLRIKQENIDNKNCTITFTVDDTGIGMTKEYLEKIWRPFEQADNTILRRYGGSGLGLAITKALVDLMGGHIEVESELGKGSSFKVTIHFEKTEQVYATGKYNFSSINALVADDDVTTCEYIKNLLNHYNIRCKMAPSGEKALSMIADSVDKNEPFNLCLLDMKMNGINGLDTAKHIIDKYGDECPVIIISAYDYSEYVEQGLKIGVKKFLSKPLFKSALFDLLVSLNADITNETDYDYKVETTEDYDFKGTKILLTEDNPTNMEIAVDLLSLANLSIDQAWNGEEAVKAFLESPKGYYKAILMDVQMPIMDGYTATQLIRQSSHPDAKTIPIIAMTANAFEQDIRASLDAGMNDHVSKPIDEKRLYEVLRKYGV